MKKQFQSLQNKIKIGDLVSVPLVDEEVGHYLANVLAVVTKVKGNKLETISRGMGIENGTDYKWSGDKDGSFVKVLDATNANIKHPIEIEEVDSRYGEGYGGILKDSSGVFHYFNSEGTYGGSSKDFPKIKK